MFEDDVRAATPVRLTGPPSPSGSAQPGAMHLPHVAPLLSVIVPTLNERANVEILFERLGHVLVAVPWEMIVVDDDSVDGTSSWAKRKALADPRLRCLRRIDRRGLAGACIEGMLSSSAPVVAVIDGDLQHDEAILPEMWRRVAEQGADLAIGTRRREILHPSAMSRPRLWLSHAGKVLSRVVLSRDVTDPMSGFFMVRRDLVEAIAPHLVTDGFKILVDILFSAPRTIRVDEVLYDFRERQSGESKLGLSILLDHVGLMVHRLSGDLIPMRMTAYLAIGAVGLATHLLILRCLVYLAPQIAFRDMETVASYGAMSVNFLLNNRLTFRERRLKGRQMLPAFLLYAAVCSVGVLANLSVANWIFADTPTWWLAGLCGALVSAFWNYAVSATVVWPLRRSKSRAPLSEATTAQRDGAAGDRAARL